MVCGISHKDINDMSYNVTGFKVKEITGLLIPTKRLYDDADSYEETKDEDGDTVKTYTYGECYISGRDFDFQRIIVDRINIQGEGSGETFDYILRPLFKYSMGKLIAVMIWEGGDSINRLLVDDGHVDETDICDFL